MATTLDAAGMVLDFKLIRRATNEVIDRYDHQYLNEVAPFDTLNPTAENIAAYMYKAISARINSDSIKVTAVTLWETERACVRYLEDEL